MSADPSGVLAAARAELAVGNLDAARALLRPLVGLHVAEAVYLTGLAFCMAGDCATARPLLAQAASAMPDAAEVQADWLQCLDCLDELVTGVQAATAACARHPRSAALHWLHGMLQLKAGHADAALAACRIAVRLAPQSAPAWLWLARTQRELGQVASAAQSLQRVRILAPQVVEYRVELAQVLLQLGEDANARSELDLVLIEQPDHALAHVALAELLLQQRELDQALQHASQAAQLLPEHPRVLSVYSLLLRLVGRTADAAAVAIASAQVRFGPQAQPQPLPRELRDTSAAKLRHDIEQLDYLHGRGLFAEAQPLAADLAQALAALEGSAIQPLPEPMAARLHNRYNRLHVHRPPAALADRAVNPDLDGSQIEQRYLSRAPGIVWVDDLLRPEALQALRLYCLESTVWFDFNHAGGYLGALFENGFAAPLLLQIADDLRRLLPNVIGELPLTQLWAFKYDSQLQGIDLHADVAAVNVNFWFTPDSANLDPERGGLELWDRAAPADWDFADYNSAGAAGQQRIRRFLARSGAQQLRVPYRCNRAVIFNSDLFHRTDAIQFAPGYLNRRINVTMLFGSRQGRVR